jgi:hypothetical protein
MSGQGSKPAIKTAGKLLGDGDAGGDRGREKN